MCARPATSGPTWTALVADAVEALLHQLFGDLAGQIRLDASPHVDVGQLIVLEFDILAELLPLSREIRLLGIRLRADRHILACRHRHGSSHKSSNSRDQNIAGGSSRCCDADDQARSRDDSVIGAEYRGSQLTDPRNEVALRVYVKATHSFLFRQQPARHHLLG